MSENQKTIPDVLSGLRVGLGYDVHALVEGRPLILGGVTIPHTLGLDGHSDAFWEASSKQYTSTSGEASY